VGFQNLCGSRGIVMRMKILTFTTLFPNRVQPAHGVFVANRLRRLVDSGAVEARVVAPVPWAPGGWMARWIGRYGAYAAIPRADALNGIAVLHSRFPVIPKIGMNIAPLLLALSQLPVLRRMIASGYDFDLIDAHYFYPDGVAAALLGKWLNKPVVITARGTDINLIPDYAVPRRQILWAAKRAGAIITVCAALRDALVAMGVDGGKVTALRNGVDLALFTPFETEVARAAARTRFGMRGLSLLSVGQLVERKGNHFMIEALRDLPAATLYLAGEGPERARLQKVAQTAGVADRVHFLGLVPHGDLPKLYGAADALVLASSREGWANVLLEAMACGTPVVATRIWGTPEVVAGAAAGVLMRMRSAAGIVEGVSSLLERLPARAATRTYAEMFSWDETTAGQLILFRRMLALRARGQSSLDPAPDLTLGARGTAGQQPQHPLAQHKYGSTDGDIVEQGNDVAGKNVAVEARHG
jgi:teichuronic acid biosynthesis glycosyltransferase TuaC